MKLSHESIGKTVRVSWLGHETDGMRGTILGVQQEGSYALVSLEDGSRRGLSADNLREQRLVKTWVDV
jgi:hypothetical protein